MYYLPQPPYALLVVGLFVGITCGLAFEATLKQCVNGWLRKNYTPGEDLLGNSPLRLPFLGVCAGICVFLASGLDIFILNSWVSYSLALPMTILIGALVWTQLEKVLQQLQQGGSKAIDLDVF
jgi:hypothetical protein